MVPSLWLWLLIKPSDWRWRFSSEAEFHPNAFSDVKMTCLSSLGFCWATPDYCWKLSDFVDRNFRAFCWRERRLRRRSIYPSWHQESTWQPSAWQSLGGKSIQPFCGASFVFLLTARQQRGDGAREYLPAVTERMHVHPPPPPHLFISLKEHRLLFWRKVVVYLNNLSSTTKHFSVFLFFLCHPVRKSLDQTINIILT